MVRYVAIAPVIKVKNMGSKLFQSIKDNQKLVDGMKFTLGMEVLTKGSMDNVVTATFLKSALGSFGSGKLMEQISDGDT